MSAASKAKGSQFERDVCVKLSLWITSGKRKDVFWRSAMSGGRATVASKRGRDVRQAGDITAVAPEGHALTDRVFIECKHYADLQFESFIVDNKGSLAKFWAVACREADQRGKHPWLIAKQNRRPALLLTRGGPYDGTSMALPLCTSMRTRCWVWSLDRILEFKPPKDWKVWLGNPSSASTVRKRERL